MFLHECLQQRTVVLLHLGDMAEEEIVLVRNQAFYLCFLDAKQHIAIVHMVNHQHTLGTVFFIRKSTDVAGLDYDFVLRKSFVKFRHLFGRQGHAIINRGFGFFYESYFHIQLGFNAVRISEVVSSA